MKKKYHKAIFLDKDGTLIPDLPFNVDPGLITISAGNADALRRLSGAGYLLIIVSNQSGVARGLFREEDLAPVWERIQSILSASGVRIDDFYYCPHDDAHDCECRKPAPGMLLQAIREHDLDTTECWMIGDILHDVEAGNRAGCRSLLLDNGNETEWVTGEFREPYALVASMEEAATLILEPALHAINLEHATA